MSTAATRLLGYLLCTLAAVASTHARDARADVLVLDTCVIECSDEDHQLIGAFRRMVDSEFARPKLAIRPRAVLEAIGDGIPGPAITDPGMTSQQIIDDLRLGVEQWVNGRYDEAAKQLEEALLSAQLNPALVVSDPTLRQLIPRAHVGRAVSLLRLGRRALAKDGIAELVRTLPEPSILDSWGSEADKIFQLARKELEAPGKGSLVVAVDDPSTIFYVNEAGEPHRSLFAALLYPGRYRILVQDSGGRSRRFLATVASNDTTILRIQWRRDAQFTSSGDHLGFVFDSTAERVYEGPYARHFAALAKSDLVIVIGRIRWHEHPALIGTLYRVSSDSAYRVGVVPITGDAASTVRELATFLLSPSKPAPRVTALTAPPWEAPASGTADGSLSIMYPLGWALSAGAIAAGSVTIAAGNDGAWHGYAGYLLGGAGILGGITTMLLYLHRGEAKPQPSTALLMAPTRAGLFAGLSWRL